MFTSRIATLAFWVALVLATAALVYAAVIEATSPPSTTPSPSLSSPSQSSSPRSLPSSPFTAPAPPAPSTLFNPAAKVSTGSEGFASWALLTSTLESTPSITGSDNQATPNYTASMSKAWIAADFLQQVQQPTQSDYQRLHVMIHDSDNSAASYFWNRLGGQDSFQRLQVKCGLTDSRHYRDWASMLLSARDASRMGFCIGSGKAITFSDRTEWLLNEMRNVAPSGNFGLPSSLLSPSSSPPPPLPAVKNGWILRSDGNWHVNCLSIFPASDSIQVLAVMTVYPSHLGQSYGENTCKNVATQLLSSSSSSSSPSASLHTNVSPR